MKIAAKSLFPCGSYYHDESEGIGKWFSLGIAA
jgi:hypothetical protein